MFFSPRALVIMLVFITQLHIHSCHAPQNLDMNNDEPAIQTRRNVPSGRWCGMARACRHDRVPVCGADGDLVGFKDLCDMYDYNCLRRRNYKQIGCPEDTAMLTVSRRPSSYYDE